MKRRQFIKAAGTTALSLPIFLNGMRLSAVAPWSVFNSMEEESDRVLVIVQMNGGNDGLNMIIPRDQYSALAAVRNNILIPENQVLKLTDKTGLHPAMKKLELLYQEERFGVVQSVGYPNQNRSHFRSTDIWTSGSPANEFWNSGWIGRYFDERYPGFPDDYPNEAHPHPFAITMGSLVSETCQGLVSNYGMTVEDPSNLFPLTEGEGSELPDTPYGNELAFLRISIAQTNAYSSTIMAAANRGSNQAEYTTANRLAQQLKNVALLISGGLQTKIYVVNIGGFDTHANQVVEGNTMVGEHSDLLERLSDAIGSFQNDLRLQGLEHRVVGMTFSEFGRKIRSNESFGTDHGTAAPMLLFGSCINPTVLGDNPLIHPNVGPEEGVPMQYDFRDVYGSILQDWFGVSADNVRSLLHDNFQKLPLVQPCSVSTSTHSSLAINELNIQSFPNPFREQVTVAFQLPRQAWVRLSVFDSLGSELEVLLNKQIDSGEHQIRFQTGRWPAGAYFYRLQIDNQQKTQRMIKL